MTSKAEEIAEEVANEIMVGMQDRDDIKRIAVALREYGAEVRKRDAEVCRTHQPKPLTVGGIIERESCAAAIEREELP